MLSRRTIRDLVVATFKKHHLPNEICTEEIADCDAIFSILRAENITLTDEQWNILHFSVVNDDPVCYFIMENNKFSKQTEDIIKAYNFPAKVEKHLLANLGYNGIIVDLLTENIATQNPDCDELNVKYNTLYTMFFMRYLSTHDYYNFVVSTDAGPMVLSQGQKIAEDAHSWAAVEVLCNGTDI